jgi:hypothetical protein
MEVPTLLKTGELSSSIACFAVLKWISANGSGLLPYFVLVGTHCEMPIDWREGLISCNKSCCWCCLIHTCRGEESTMVNWCKDAAARMLDWISRSWADGDMCMKTTACLSGGSIIWRRAHLYQVQRMSSTGKAGLVPKKYWAPRYGLWLRNFDEWETAARGIGFGRDQKPEEEMQNWPDVTSRYSFRHTTLNRSRRVVYRGR